MEVSFAEVFGQAERLLEQGQLEEAVKAAEKAFDIRQRLSSSSGPSLDPSTLPVLNLLAVIHLESGNPEEGRDYFLQAAAVDEDGAAPFTKAAGGGVEKYFYLSQLSEEGGQDSVNWLEKGATILRREIAKHQTTTSPTPIVLTASTTEVYDEPTTLPSLQAKLARALCSQIEIYMTDLSFQPDSEPHCERLISEALPLFRASGTKDPTTLQTLANIRISQCRVDEARPILLESLALWGGDKEDAHGSPLDGEGDEDQDEDEETNPSQTHQRKTPAQNDDPAQTDPSSDPDFPTRISLSRLLLEVNLLPQAQRVLDRLVAEDDTSVEAWYLAGWCLYLLSGLHMADTDDDDATAPARPAAKAAQTRIDTDTAESSLEHLAEALRLSNVLDYEDDRLCGHAAELVAELETALGREKGSAVRAAETGAKAAVAGLTGGIAGMGMDGGEGEEEEGDDWESGSGSEDGDMSE